jgi:hypothetical protein
MVVFCGGLFGCCIVPVHFLIELVDLKNLAGESDMILGADREIWAC